MTRAAGGSGSRVWFQGTGRVSAMGRPSRYPRAYLTPAGVERLNSRARKVYLNRQLHDVEDQIDSVLDHLAAHVEAAEELPQAAEPMMNAEHWSTLLDLGYLMAEREALAEAIEGL